MIPKMRYDKVASTQETNTFEVEFEPRAYSKMILHTAKHPHCAVSGLLLASGGRKPTGQIVLTDCIPLFHQSEGKYFYQPIFPCDQSLFAQILYAGELLVAI